MNYVHIIDHSYSFPVQSFAQDNMHYEQDSGMKSNISPYLSLPTSMSHDHTHVKRQKNTNSSTNLNSSYPFPVIHHTENDSNVFHEQMA